MSEIKAEHKLVSSKVSGDMEWSIRSKESNAGYGT